MKTSKAKVLLLRVSRVLIVFNVGTALGGASWQLGKEKRPAKTIKPECVCKPPPYKLSRGNGR
jgi:hypothetical protein